MKSVYSRFISYSDDNNKKNGNDIDFWRDTNVRYLGYANEVGEAIGPVYKQVVRPSYVIAFGYVGCDTIDKTMKAIKTGKSNNEIMKVTVDTFIWQLFASVLIPGKIIHVVANGATELVKKESIQKNLSPVLKKWSPTALGLMTIPIIIHPIDHFVDYCMDNTIRIWWK